MRTRPATSIQDQKALTVRPAGPQAAAAEREKRMPLFDRKNNLRAALCKVAIFALLLSSLVISASAQAGMIAYNLSVSEHLEVLRHPGDMMVAKMAAWQPQHVLAVARDAPFFELLNNSETAAISELSVALTAPGFNFDWATFVEASPGVTVTPVSVDQVNSGVRSAVLKLAFTGLTPGKFVRFHADLDRNTSMALVDYRQALFQVNGNGMSDNAVATVTFDDPVLGSTSLTKPLPDFVNHMPTMFDLSFRAHYGMDHVMTYTDGDVSIQEVPEPSTLALLSFGIVGLTVFGLRRRGR